MRWTSRIAAIPLVALLCVAFGWAQEETPKPGAELLDLTLDEGMKDILSLLGQPSRVDDSLPNYVSWFYRGDAHEEDSFAHVFCFRRSDSKLVSVTRNFDPEELVDHLFPEKSYSVKRWPSEDAPQFSVRVRYLSSERLILAMGSDRPGKPTGQLLLISRSAIPIFIPWVLKEFEER